ncbi:hypothetical protein TetV_452 [Tetraselmis virus 1]|uniref:Uncharacterized protein n=1 Tax=Tetraselmis virus 1 TaxID=2060617 RepID=A0A2P0VNQ2_9VIRU|nr:hypothetical protein QJ968_gp602 [Tetraselmis virus 1]AUF82534.1 hypothetical protein TetV_452 [Tetraselmis virus 1]
MTSESAIRRLKNKLECGCLLRNMNGIPLAFTNTLRLKGGFSALTSYDKKNMCKYKQINFGILTLDDSKNVLVNGLPFSAWARQFGMINDHPKDVVQIKTQDGKWYGLKIVGVYDIRVLFDLDTKKANHIHFMNHKIAPKTIYEHEIRVNSYHYK